VPAYYAVSFHYDRAAVGRDYLGVLYETMLQGGFSFGGVLAWGCPGDLTLDEIIRWNQERFDRDFKLGLDEDISHDYRQILLRHPCYAECRVIVLNAYRYAYVIVPERDVFAFDTIAPAELVAKDEAGLRASIRTEQIAPLREMALTVWRRGLVTAVQTCGEIGAPTGAAALAAGEMPSMLPFAIVPVGWSGVSRIAEEEVRIPPVGETGLLLESR